MATAELDRKQTYNLVIVTNLNSCELEINTSPEVHVEDSTFFLRTGPLKEDTILGDESWDDLQDVCPQNPPSRVPKRVAPDGGFGWFVVLGCFIAHVVFGGLDRSEGVFFLLLTSKFEESAQLTSWPGAVVTTLQLVLGPFANILTNRCSTRVSVLIGATLMFIGLTLNSLATNIYFFFMSHSIIDGVGRGLAYVPGLIIVGMYFDKRAGLATGLATSGTGVGTFVIVPLSQYLADNYGFQGTFLILGGFACHMFIAGMLYRPISMHYQSRTEVDRCNDKLSGHWTDSVNKEELQPLKDNVVCHTPLSHDQLTAHSSSVDNNVAPPLKSNTIMNSFKSEICENIDHSPKSEICENIGHSPKSEICENIGHSLKSEICENIGHSPKSEICENIGHSPKSEICENIGHSPKSEICENIGHSPKSKICENIANCQKCEICENTTNSLKSESRQSQTRFPNSVSCQEKTHSLISDLHYNKPTSQRVKGDSCLSSSIKICFPIEPTNKRPTNLFRLDLLTKPPFLMYCLSIFTFTLAFRATFTFLPALMESKGIPSWESPLALSIAGAVDTFGRIGAGLLLDMPKLRQYRLIIYNAVIFGVSLVAFLLPSFKIFTSFCVISGFYGLLTGAYISQKSVVLADILESNDIPSSFGILMVFQGLGNLFGPPIFGAFKDVLGDFRISFYLGGSLLILSGFIMGLSNTFNFLQKRKENVKDITRLAG